MGTFRQIYFRLHNIRGVSLLEMIFVSGVLMVIALAAISLISSMYNQLASMNDNFDSLQNVNIVSLSLENSSACELLFPTGHTIDSTNLAGITPIQVNQVKQAVDTSFRTIIKTSASTETTGSLVESIKITDFINGSDANEVFASLIIEPLQKAGRIKPRNRKVPLIITLGGGSADARLVSTCRSNSGSVTAVSLQTIRSSVQVVTGTNSVSCPSGKKLVSGGAVCGAAIGCSGERSQLTANSSSGDTWTATCSPVAPCFSGPQPVPAAVHAICF